MKKYKLIKRIRRNGSSLAINIPSEIVELLSLSEGEMIELEVRKIQ